LFQYIAVCYVKPLEWAAGVVVSDLYHNLFHLGGGFPDEHDILCPKDFKLLSQIT